jgi:site-specific DNA-methyltransferase (adenine-specific)
MPENTDHPTQKAEKLMAKIILASSAPGDLVFDPFLGSGTTSVTAKKLGRRYMGIEREREYAALAEKRLAMAGGRTGEGEQEGAAGRTGASDRESRGPRIQGYENGVFLHRNTKD